MLKSMTGFGAATTETPELSVTVEVKSLNSKHNDTYIKLPSIFSSKELDVKNLISKELERGKISVIINYVNKSIELNRPKINQVLAQSYYAELKKLAESLGAPQHDLFRLVMQMPDVYLRDLDEEKLDNDWRAVEKTVQEAVNKCNEFRMQEGAVLAKELTEYIANIRKPLEEIEVLDPERIKRVRERIALHVSEYISAENLDQNRFEQELIFYIERLDIQEEKVRLRKHLDYFSETLRSPDSNGRKLGFVSQELGREINTIGSKANDADIQKLVVAMKEELEKIKEQLQNIL